MYTCKADDDGWSVEHVSVRRPQRDRSRGDACATGARRSELTTLATTHTECDVGWTLLVVMVCFIWDLCPMQAEVASELDQLLEQQTQMDIKMSSFQHMLYG